MPRPACGSCRCESSRPPTTAAAGARTWPRESSGPRITAPGSSTSASADRVLTARSPGRSGTPAARGGRRRRGRQQPRPMHALQEQDDLPGRIDRRDRRRRGGLEPPARVLLEHRELRGHRCAGRRDPVHRHRDGEPVQLRLRIWDGTSMATPHVAAAAALVLAYRPICTPDQVEHGSRRLRSVSPATPPATRGCTAPGSSTRQRRSRRSGRSSPGSADRYSCAIASSTSRREACHAGSSAATRPAMTDATRNSAS